jgi:hypothetical protein
LVKFKFYQICLNLFKCVWPNYRLIRPIFVFSKNSCSFRSSNAFWSIFSEFHWIFSNFVKCNGFACLWIFFSCQIFKHWWGSPTGSTTFGHPRMGHVFGPTCHRHELRLLPELRWEMPSSGRWNLLATCWLWFALMQIAREPCIPLSFLFSHRRWRQVSVKGSKTLNIIHPLVATRVISNSKKGVRSNLYLATNTSLQKEISMVSGSVRGHVSLTNSRKLRKTSKNKQARPNEFHGCPPTTGGGGLTVGENSPAGPTVSSGTCLSAASYVQLESLTR